MSKHKTKKGNKKQKKKVPNNKQLAVRIKRLENTAELKYDDSYNSSTWTNNVTVLNVTGIAQGDNINERVGEELTAKYLNIRIRNVKTPDPAAAYYRVILFWDKQSNAGPPVLYVGAGLANANTALIDDSVVSDQQVAPLNYRTKQRYHVLWDKMYALNPYGGLTSNFAHDKVKNFNLGGAKIKYGGNASTDLTSRALYFFYTNTHGSPSVNTSDRVGIRFWYTDS